MRCLVRLLILALGLIAATNPAQAAELFTGHWSIDMRTTSERQRGAECGGAAFDLTQTGETITGSHSFATVDCGRLNEAGPVSGVAVGNTAVLVVASGRNGAMALGTAKLVDGKLHWRQVEEIKTGSPEGDSPLILGEGTLTRKSAHPR